MITTAAGSVDDDEKNELIRNLGLLQFGFQSSCLDKYHTFGHYTEYELCSKTNAS